MFHLVLYVDNMVLFPNAPNIAVRQKDPCSVWLKMTYCTFVLFIKVSFKIQWIKFTIIVHRQQGEDNKRTATLLEQTMIVWSVASGHRIHFRSIFPFHLLCIFQAPKKHSTQTSWMRYWYINTNGYIYVHIPVRLNISLHPHTQTLAKVKFTLEPENICWRVKIGEHFHFSSFNSWMAGIRFSSFVQVGKERIV